MPAVSRPRFTSLVKLLIIAMALGLIFGLYRLIFYQGVSRHVQRVTHSIPGCTGITVQPPQHPFFSLLQAHLSNATFNFADGIAPITVDSIHLRRFPPRRPTAPDIGRCFGTGSLSIPPTLCFRLGKGCGIWAMV